MGIRAWRIGAGGKTPDGLWGSTSGARSGRGTGVTPGRRSAGRLHRHPSKKKWSRPSRIAGGCAHRVSGVMHQPPHALAVATR
ncbi:hypothetical protein [Streptosporangium roseum]|uniref:hypothetical protein n=1 Tax=Streptosporangium roseum TaxID=2001 RepID=UPI0033264749